jgi:predicted SprT family Zn-dependent metalloprotease
MELQAAEQLAIDLMKQFGIASTWRFEFDNAVRRFGCCHKSQNLITLSRELVLKNEKAEVEDTIRHEIAHALVKTPIIYGRRGRGTRDIHGADWKAMCKVTGAKPIRCFNEEVDRVEGDWQAICAGCGKKHTMTRRPKRELWCADKACKAKHGKLKPIQKLEFKHKNALDNNAPNPFDQRKAAIEAMKAQMRREQEMEEMKTKIAALESKLGGK